MKILPSTLLATSFALLSSASLPAATPDAAAKAVNEFAFDLLARKDLGAGNTLISPFSIQAALAMTYAGADGATRAEMAKVLHIPEDEAGYHGSFAALIQALQAAQRESAETVQRQQAAGRKADPLALHVANRLFGQRDYGFRQGFLDMLATTYEAPLQKCDFVTKAEAERQGINAWVAETTRDRIRDLIPSGALDRETRLVLVNAIYLKAPWASPFPKGATKPAPFFVGGGQPVEVPTMVTKTTAGLVRHDGYSIVTLPYAQGQLQFVIVLPDQADGLDALEQAATPDLFAAAAGAPRREVVLHLPKFKLEPPLLALRKALIEMGMKSAFDQPQGSANFDRMAPRTPAEYLFISEVFHKTFLALDEEGTEAAAATAVIMSRAMAAPAPSEPPPVVKVDRPFLFSIQHCASGACLFLGRVTDPR
jgi:serpin B